MRAADFEQVFAIHSRKSSGGRHEAVLGTDAWAAGVNTKRAEEDAVRTCRCCDAMLGEQQEQKKRLFVV